MDLGCKKEKSFFFPFLLSFLECHEKPQKVVVRCHASPYRDWDCSCPGNIPLAAGWAVLGLLPVRGLCCDCAFVWIVGSVLPFAWLLGWAHVQILGISLPLSRAVQECWRSWQLHRCAGIPTVVWTASQGSACEKQNPCARCLAIFTLSVGLNKGHCFCVCLVKQF